MFKIETLNLNHQLILEKKFKALNLCLSEYSFANLYLFREIHKYEVLFFEEELFIKGRMRNNTSFLMPTSHPNQWAKSIRDYLRDHSLCLYPIPFEWLTYFEKQAKTFSFQESESDYLYAINKISMYPGRTLHSKRNLVKQLFKQHSVEYHAYEPKFEKAAVEVIDKWQAELSTDKTHSDYYSVIEAIHLYEQLHLQGYIYYVDTIPTGILIGEALNPTCFAFHFVKSTKSIHGINQFMFQHFAQSLEELYEFINLEQDLGLSNLRQTKRSYQPDRLLHKYFIYLN